MSGKTLIGVDGSSIALTLIEGGMELQVVPADGTRAKTTFTFMTDRMGTVVEDSGSPSAGSSVTGFFRLTGKGVEIRYADGRSAMLSASADGGVQMALDGDSGPSCRAWYPAGHAFSDSRKENGAERLCQQAGPGRGGQRHQQWLHGCAAAGQHRARAGPPVAPRRPRRRLRAKAKPERRSQAKAPGARWPRRPTASATISRRHAKAGLETVSVKTSEVHTIDGGAIAVPSLSGAMAMAPPPPPAVRRRNDAGHCLKVDSDGGHWGFRNACDFAVQFAYCMAGGDNNLTACGDSDAVTTSVAGSVAANGFGALMADTSLKEKDAAHNFRWVACARRRGRSGGASGSFRTARRALRTRPHRIQLKAAKPKG